MQQKAGQRHSKKQSEKKGENLQYPKNWRKNDKELKKLKKFTKNWKNSQNIEKNYKKMKKWKKIA